MRGGSPAGTKPSSSRAPEASIPLRRGGGGEQEAAERSWGGRMGVAVAVSAMGPRGFQTSGIACFIRGGADEETAVARRVAGDRVNFESSPFKLTTEMIQLMGGNSNFQPYRWFCELCVKAYLAARPFADEICQMVSLMLDSGLPCFKGEATIKKLRSRFQLEKNERGAADFMIDRINESCKNQRTVFYDSFQWATNGIPY